MDYECLCGAKYTTAAKLHDHVVDRKHHVQCSCGKVFEKEEYACQHYKGVRKSGHPKFNVIRYSDASGATEDVGVAAMLTGTICELCDKNLKTKKRLRQHVTDAHPMCPTCNKAVRNDKELVTHQKSAKHCYCVEHHTAYKSQQDFKEHIRSKEHVTGFGCIVCNRTFNTQQGLNDHLKNARHPQREIPDYTSAAAEKTKAAVDEANLHCGSCKKTFKSVTAFRQHKASVKHHPLSELKCPLSKDCGGTFISPSALVFHLESGACKSGMTRLKLNAVVHAHDTQRHITYKENAVASISTANSVGSLTSMFDRVSMTTTGNESGVLIPTPDDSDYDSETSQGSGIMITPSATTSRSRASSIGSGVLLTPSATASHSRTTSISGDQDLLTPLSSDNGAFEWSFVDNVLEQAQAAASTTSSAAETIVPDSNNLWPCPECNKTFKKQIFLTQHMDSPVAHAEKIFHCPTAVLGLHGGGKTKAFKTLSGMAQHIEVGACVGGKGTLEMIVGLFESQIKAATGKGVKLLCDHA